MFFTDDPLLVFIEKKASKTKLFKGMFGKPRKFSNEMFNAAKKSTHSPMSTIEKYKAARSARRPSSMPPKLDPNSPMNKASALKESRRVRREVTKKRRDDAFRKEVIEDKPKRPTASRNLGDSLRLAALRRRNESI